MFTSAWEILFGPKLTLTCRAAVKYHDTERVWAITVLYVWYLSITRLQWLSLNRCIYEISICDSAPTLV